MLHMYHLCHDYPRLVLQAHPGHGAMLVEILREPGDILGVGLSRSVATALYPISIVHSCKTKYLFRCNDTQAIIIESMKQASLADRCGALHVGDILLSVAGRPVARCSVDQVTELIRDTAGPVARLEVLPGALARTRASVRASLPSPCFSTMQRRAGRGQHQARPQERLPRQLSHNNLFELRGGGGRQREKERKKYVSFTVELDRAGGPLGITLATEESSEGGEEAAPPRTPPILISSMAEGGLAHTTRAIQLRDELVEVNGTNVKGKTLKEAIPLLQNAGNLVKLKLTRVVTIPERECRVPSFRLPPCSPRMAASPSPIYAPVQPPASPIYAPVTPKPPQHGGTAASSGLRSPSLSVCSQDKNSSNTSSKTDDELPTVTLLPQNGPKGALKNMSTAFI